MHFELNALPSLLVPHELKRKHPNAAEVLGAIPSADYNDWIVVGQILHRETGGSELGLELYDNWSQRADCGKYEPGRCEEKWGTFGKNAGGVGWGTLVHLAKHYGFGLSCSNPEDVFDQVAGATSKKTEKLLYTLDELAAELGAVEFLISGVLVSYGVSILHAIRKAGKSTVVVSLAMHIASKATTWCGHRIEKHGRTVYISGEGTRGLIPRFQVAANELGVDPIQAVRISKRPSRITMDGAPNTDELAAWGEAIAQFQAEDPDYPVRLIVIDTLSRNIGQGADECKEGDAKAFMESIERLAEENACAALVVHHQPHGANRSRGSTALEAHAEVILSATSSSLKSPTPTLTNHAVNEDRDSEEEFETESVDNEAPTARLVELRVEAGKEVAGGRKLRGILEGVKHEDGKPTVARFRPLRPNENPSLGDKKGNENYTEARVLGASLMHGERGMTIAIRLSHLGTTTFRSALKRLEATGAVKRIPFQRRRILQVNPDCVPHNVRSGLTKAETLKLQGLMEDKNESD